MSAPADDPETEAARRRRGLPKPMPETEFEDEPPGAYLTGLALGWGGAAAWGLVLFFLTLAQAVLGLLFSRDLIDIPGDLEAPLELSWQCTPLVALAGFLILGFIRANQSPPTPKGARQATAALGLHGLAILLWAFFRWGLGVGFTGE